MFSMRPPLDALEPGTIVDGRYRVSQLIARTNDAAVYAATHLMMSRNVTLHMLCSGGEPEARRFHRAARIVAMLRHPNVVTTHDMGRWEGLPYLVLEYLEGHSLAERSSLRGPMRLEEFASIAHPLLSALSYIHSHNVVHRDVSAENIMLLEGHERDDLLKLTQFSFSKELGTTTYTSQQEQQRMIASLTHVAPEQILTPDKVDHRVDVYAAAAVFYRLLGGVPPFQGRSLADLAAAILERKPEPLGEITDQVPIDLDAAILKGLDKRPDHRFQSAAELWAAIRGAVREDALE